MEGANAWPVVPTQGEVRSFSAGGKLVDSIDAVWSDRSVFYCPLSTAGSVIETIRKAVHVFRTGGTFSLMNAGVVKLLVGSPFIRKALGDLRHQQLIAYLRLGYWPQISNPRTFNEKLMHRKLYTDDPLFARIEDKWAVREYVAERVGEEILPEVYHVTDDPETIPFGSLPDSYVLKPTHQSGHVTIVDEDDTPDRDRVLQDCRDWLDRQYGSIKGEYWYRNIKPRIIVEERLTDDRFYVPADLKFYVFNGRVEMLYVVQRDTNGTHKQYNYYNRDWEPLEMDFHDWEAGSGYERPSQLEKMIDIAEALGEGLDHIRVDLYALDDDRVVFGELTVCEGSGWNRFSSWEDDLAIGSHWTVAHA